MKMTKIILALLLFATISMVAEENKAKLYIGLKAGLNIPNFEYSNDGYSSYDQSIFIKPLYGISGEYLFNQYISFKPDIIVIGRGVEIENDNFDYAFHSTYTELNMPFALTIRNIFKYDPYILAGPYIGFATGGDITYDDGANYETDVSSANISSMDFGLRLGIGLKYDVNFFGLNALLCPEIAYSMGLLDTYSTDEIDEEAIALNDDDYHIVGTRHNRGLEFSLSFLIPIGSGKKKAKVQEYVYEEKTNTEIIPDKYCYTIDEILQYQKQGYNIYNKRICMFNIYFEVGKSDIKSESKEYLNKIVNLMNERNDIAIVINGHTDSSGDELYNMKLSEDRAESVYKYIKSQGINSKKLSYKGYGESKPIGFNDTKEGRAKNRRVEFEIVSY